MKVEKIPSEYDIKLSEKLVQIRKLLNIKSQEVFFDRYLKKVCTNDLNSKSSIQGHMSKLENGIIPCPIQYLPIYAQLIGVTVDQLLSDVGVDAPQDLKTNNSVTYKMLASVFIELLKHGTIKYDGKDFDLTSYIIRVNDQALGHICEKISTMQGLLTDGTIEQDDFDNWLDGFLKKADLQIINHWDNGIRILFEKYIKSTDGNYLEAARRILKDTDNNTSLFGIPLLGGK